MGMRRGRPRLAQGNIACTHGGRVTVSTQLSQIARKAQLDRKVRFTSLAHLLTPAFLKETWGMMNRRGASGIDGESTKQFESELEQRVQDIYARLKADTYRAPPVRRRHSFSQASRARQSSCGAGAALAGVTLADGPPCHSGRVSGNPAVGGGSWGAACAITAGAV